MKERTPDQVAFASHSITVAAAQRQEDKCRVLLRHIAAAAKQSSDPVMARLGAEYDEAALILSFLRTGVFNDRSERNVDLDPQAERQPGQARK